MKKAAARYHISDKQHRKVNSEEKRLALMMRALKAIHSAGSPESMTPKDLERQRAGQELLGRLVTPMIGMKWEPFELSGMKAAWVRPEWGHDHHKIILYCHGGGYTSGNLGYSRPLASKLSHTTGWETLSFEYRLAPEHPFPAAADDALAAWDYLMQLGYGARDITVAGDSAGGNMALVLCHRLKAAGRMLPGRLILMSPWTDMTASGYYRGLYSRRPQRLRRRCGCGGSPAVPTLWGFHRLPSHTDPGWLQRDSLFGFRHAPPADDRRRRGVPDGGMAGYVACISDVPHQKGCSGHGACWAVFVGLRQGMKKQP